MSKILAFPATPFVSVPVDQAILCINCNTVSNSDNDGCGVCGSTATLRLNAILNRQPLPPDPPATALPRPTPQQTTTATAPRLQVVRSKTLAFVSRRQNQPAKAPLMRFA